MAGMATLEEGISKTLQREGTGPKATGSCEVVVKVIREDEEHIVEGSLIWTFYLLLFFIDAGFGMLPLSETVAFFCFFSLMPLVRFQGMACNSDHQAESITIKPIIVCCSTGKLCQMGGSMYQLGLASNMQILKWPARKGLGGWVNSQHAQENAVPV